MNEKDLVANPRRLRSLLNALIFALCETAGVAVYLIFKIDSPVTVGEKTVQTVLVCFLLILTLFMVFPVIMSLRSLYPRAILTVTDEKIILEKKREIALSELKEISVVKNGKKLIIKSETGEMITLNDGDVNIPLETLEYAIKLRAEKLSGKKSEEKI